MTHEQLWASTLAELELQVTKPNYNTWLKNTSAIEVKDGVLIVGVADDFRKSYLDKHYAQKIHKILFQLSKGEVKSVHFIISHSKATSPSQPMFQEHLDSNTASHPVTSASYVPPTVQSDGIVTSSTLNPAHLFSTFIVGKNNELAHAASQAVARKPGSVYNPLFLYGGVGLGKTHLMHAIGNEIIRMNPGLRILYTNSEKFTNEFIHAVRNGQAEEFKNMYRSIDVLLIDDIQFIAGKDSTQEEFFHTFNELHQHHKQIVLTSDRPPKAIASLEKRLVSRFEWGMIADIGVPDLETRMAILEHKAHEKKINLSRDVIQFVASHIHNNVRELEGVLNTINAHMQLKNMQPTLENVKEILGSVTPVKKVTAITPKDVILAVGAYYDITIETLVGQSRKREYVIPRQVAMYLMREELRASYPAIGEVMGGRDHTTVMHGCDKVEKALDEDPQIQKDIQLIRQQLIAG